MPKAAQNENDEQISVCRFRTVTVATEGDVEVISEPLRQGDVPASPELGDRPRCVGMVEIPGQVEAEQQAQADGHVRIPGEVEVDLQGKADRAEPGDGKGQVSRWDGEDGIGRSRQRVGEDDLLPEADNKPANALGEGPCRVLAAVELIDDVFEADDGSGDKLGKHADVERDGEGPSYGRDIPTIDIDEIGHGLEREE